MSRRELQNGVTIGFQCLIAALGRVHTARRSGPKDELRVNVHSNASNQVLTMQGSFKKGEYGWKLSGAHPLLCCHVVLVDVESAENWASL